MNVSDDCGVKITSIPAESGFWKSDISYGNPNGKNLHVL